MSPRIAGCGSPGRPAHGQTELRREGFVVPSSQDYQLGDLVSYSCQPHHFSLLGPSRRVCSRDGVWRPALPSCGEWRDYHYQLSAQRYLIISVHCGPLWSTVVQPVQCGGVCTVGLLERSSSNTQFSTEELWAFRNKKSANLLRQPT